MAKICRSRTFRNLPSTTVLLGGLFLLLACGSNDKPSAQPTSSIEAQCKDGIDNDGDGRADCADIDCQSPGGDCKAAPDLDRTVATTVAESASFLFTADNPLQKGANPAAFDKSRLAALHGKVVDATGLPIAGARVTIQGHDEYGYTFTRADGQYDLAVNGGSCLLVDFSLEGYLPAQRSTQPAWLRHTSLDDVGLVAASGKTTAVPSNSESSQTLKGEAVDDSYGHREPLVIFEPGTTANAILADGTKHELSHLTVTVTEYPLDSNQGFLPGSPVNVVGLAYALEFEVAEAKKLGASHVEFSAPVSLYVENFLELPVGTTLPISSYFRDKGQWEKGKTGHVIAIIDIANGTAAIDSDGDGIVDDPTSLDALGITASDLKQLAARYPAGTELWHGKVTHFSTHQAQIKATAPKGAIVPSGVGLQFSELDKPSRTGPMLVEPQAVWQAIPVTGTPYSLEYLSNRTMAYGAGYQHEFPLTLSTIPTGLKRITAKLTVAGRTFTATYDAKPLQSFVVAWDGKDNFGRLVQGPQNAELTITYIYDGTLLSGKKSGKPIDVPLSQKFQVKLGLWDAKGMGLGGFAFDVLHAYDPAQHTIYFGNGDQRSGDSVALVTNPVCSDPSFGLGTPDSIVIASDGSAIITDDQQQSATAPGRILRVTTNGKPSVLVGPGAAGAAARIVLGQPQGIVVLDDGSMVVADLMKKAVRRIDGNGLMTTLVGAEPSDSPIAQYSLVHPDGLALGPRQEIYIVDSDRVLVYEAGKVSLFAGDGTETADGGLAVNALFAKPSGVAVAIDGSAYISDRDGHRVRKVLVDGTITTVAGNGTAGFDGDGRNASEAVLNGPRGLAIGPDGSIYVVDQGNGRVRRISPDGLIQTVIGGGSKQIRSGQLATDVSLVDSSSGAATGPDGIAMGLDGSLYVAAMNTVFRVSPALPQLNEKDNLIPSADGMLLYHFDNRGKHLETIDAMTGVSELYFGYDSFGYLLGITDENGQPMMVNRATDGTLTGLTAPFGQATKIEISTDGNRCVITDPIARRVELDWDPATKQLTSVNTPWSDPSTFQYDSLGRLTDVRDPTGASKYRLTAGLNSSGFMSVSVSERDGQPTEYLSRNPAANVWERSVKAPDGTHTDWSELGTSEPTLLPDGTKIVSTYVPDDAFGPQSMVPSQTTTTLPSGKTLTSNTLRTKKVSDITNALSVQDWRDEVEINNRVYATEYHRADRTMTTTTPMGRSITLTMDLTGHPISMSSPDLPTVSWTYDADWHVASVTKTAGGVTRTEVRGYGSDGWLSSRKNSLGEQTTYAWDLVGRPSIVTRPDQKTTAWNFDNADNVTALTTPGSFAHGFAYDPSSNLVTLSTPPAVTQPPTNALATGSQSYTYGPQHQLLAITRSDGSSIQFAYDAALRLTSQTLKNASLAYGYDSGGTLTSVNRSDSESVRVEMTHDGDLWTGTKWTGSISGSVSASYDDNFWLKTLTVNNASSVTFSYDDDGLVIGASSTSGAMSIIRDFNTGLVTSTALGNVGTTIGYNEFAEPNLLTAAVSGTALFGQSIVRDDLGRVASVDEQISGAMRSKSYTYDPVGRLSTETRDGITTTYGYDANGNRTSVQVGSDPAVIATYDAQDRIVTYGDQAYGHTPHGDLLARATGDDSLVLTYDELGNLTSAFADSPTQTINIDYVVDGFGRRVARKVNGTFDRAWLYRDGLRPVAEIDSAGVFTHFVYAESQSGAPDFLIRTGVLYRVIKDHLGSVLLIVNAQSGAVAQSLEYDAFGRVLSDTNPGFQPFGFAGGLYDAVTGLVRFGARDYDAEMGRWTNKDPIGFAGGDTNVYAYVCNDPVNFADPTGHDRSTAVALGAMLGADIGFTVGGGTGLVAGIATGGVPALGLTPAGAIGGAGLGAGLGAVVGGAAYDTVQAVGDWVDGLIYARKADLGQIDWIVDKYGLSKDQRGRLHRQISKRGLSLEEIEEIAEEIAAEGNNSRKDGR